MYLLLQSLVSRLVGCMEFVGYGLTHFGGLVFRWVGGVVRHAYNSVVGCPRIARGVPWAGSVTSGEACGYLCTEKEGFTYRWFWRAPCSSGTNEWKLHAVDT